MTFQTFWKDLYQISVFVDKILIFGNQISSNVPIWWYLDTWNFRNFRNSWNSWNSLEFVKFLEFLEFQEFLKFHVSGGPKTWKTTFFRKPRKTRFFAFSWFPHAPALGQVTFSRRKSISAEKSDFPWVGVHVPPVFDRKRPFSRKTATFDLSQENDVFQEKQRFPGKSRFRRIPKTGVLGIAEVASQT